MLHVVLWKWNQPNAREPYRPQYVNTIAAQLRANLLGLEHRIICITDDANGLTGLDAIYPLWTDCDDLSNASKATFPSCYRRLKLYDPQTQHRELEIRPGERILSIDVDTAVISTLTSLLEGLAKYRYIGWARTGRTKPKVFNGSFQLFTAGDLAEIWSEFAKDPFAASREAHKAGYDGSDQAWLSYKLVGREGCEGLTYPEIASYPNNIRQLRALERKVKIVFFHGAIKPWHPQALRQSAWLTRYWGF